MKKIRKRVTYANVMSSLAVFLVLGGGAAYAAKKIGSNEIKGNAITTGKIKKEAVTSAKIKKNAITSAKIKKEAVTGSKIKLSTLGTVPSASSAGNANTVNGQTVTKIFKTLSAGQSTVIASIAGFTITASCESSNVDVTLSTPSTPASVATVEGNGNNEGPIFDYDSQEAGTPSTIRLDGEAGSDNSYGESTFSAAMSDGKVLSGDVGYDYDTFDNNPENICIVYGEVANG